MFKCQACNGVSDPRVRPEKVVTEFRPVNYINNNTKLKIGEGWEIASEKNLCFSCASSLDSIQSIEAIVGMKRAKGEYVDKYVEVRNYYTEVKERGAGGERHSYKDYQD